MYLVNHRYLELLVDYIGSVGRVGGRIWELEGQQAAVWADRLVVLETVWAVGRPVGVVAFVVVQPEIGTAEQQTVPILLLLRK